LDEYSWASAVGRIRILEKRFLSKAELLQLAGALSLESALAALRDTIYGPYIVKTQAAESYDRVLQERLAEEYDMIAAMSPEPMVIASYRGRHDFHNLKVIAKNQRLGMAVQEEAFSRIGNIDPDLLRGMLEDHQEAQDEWRPPKDHEFAVLRRAYEETASFGPDADGGYSQALNALCMDAFIDRVYYTWFTAVMKRHGYDSLITYAEHEVDLTNLRMALRGRRQGLGAEVMAQVFLPGGTIRVSDLSDAYAESDEALKGVFGGTPLLALADKGFGLVAERVSLTRWEKACDDALMGIVKRARFSPMGPEPAYGYVFGREIETRNLRVILSGKESQVSSKEISERLREPYV
jgi:V/A-type H+-transporting ATPase subunit C